MSETAVRLPFAALGQTSGFRGDIRFAPELVPHLPVASEPEDPVARAWAEGFAAGEAEARAEAEDRARTEAQAREALSLGFARLDKDMAETLRQCLRDTVAALCEAALAPLALDEAALAGRIERALALFQRAEDERTIRLNPDDMALISDRMASDWHVVPDPMLQRGALRIETGSGGIEDGPAQWRQAIAEALP
jgi:flagellar assembly protein FliH